MYLFITIRDCIISVLVPLCDPNKFVEEFLKGRGIFGNIT